MCISIFLSQSFVSTSTLPLGIDVVLLSLSLCISYHHLCHPPTHPIPLYSICVNSFSVFFFSFSRSLLRYLCLSRGSFSCSPAEPCPPLSQHIVNCLPPILTKHTQCCCFIVLDVSLGPFQLPCSRGQTTAGGRSTQHHCLLHFVLVSIGDT